MEHESVRRSLIKGAAWAAPAAVIAVAAPAVAASAPCGSYAVEFWDFGAGTTGQLSNPARYSVGNFVLEVANSGSTAQAGNFYANNGSGDLASSPGAYPGALRLRSRQEQDSVSTPQIVAFKFSRPVRDLSFSIRDIDNDIPSNDPLGFQSAFSDRVSITGPSPRPGVVTRGARLQGQGTDSDPWRTSDNGNQGPDSRYDVSLTWSGPVSEVSVRYWQGIRTRRGAAPAIWIDSLRFTLPC